MKNNIQQLLQKISFLLAENNEKNWAEQFGSFRVKLETDYAQTLHEIKRVFGGAGSLNDLVLQRNGQMLTCENNELNTLLDQLYDNVNEEINQHRNS